MPKPNSANYIDKQEFLNKVVEYRASCAQAKKDKKPKPKITNYLATCLMKIAENVARMPKYSGYTFKDIMIADAVENCVRYFDNFDPNHAKKNPFGYFTTCTIYAFWRRIHLEKKELYTKYKIAQQAGTFDDSQQKEIEDNGGESIQHQQLFENISEFIGKFEENLNKSKAKAKQAKPKKGIENFQED